MDLKSFLASKKILLLSLIAPIVIFIRTFFEKPYICGNLLGPTRSCENYFDYLNGSFAGRLAQLEMLFYLVVGLLIAGIAWSAFNKKKYLLLTLTILLGLVIIGIVLVLIDNSS